MERETKKIKTPDGHEIEVCAYLTSNEKKAIDEVIYKHARLEGDPEGKKVKPKYSISGSALFEAQDLALRFLLKSVDGNSEDAYGELMKLRAKDYDFVIAEINRITRADQDFLAA